MTITLAQIKTHVLQRADMVNSNFIGNTGADSELNYFVNKSIEELYDELVSRFEDYYVDSFQFTIGSGDDGYTVPANVVYKLRGLDFQIGGDWVTIHRYTFEERNRGNRQINRAMLGLTNIKYRWVGNRIKIIPADQAPGTYQMWYIPRTIDLSNDTDTLQADLEQWIDYVIVDAAIKCMQKEESDVSVLMAQKMALLQRIDSMAANRDAGSAEVVTDVRNYIYDDPLVRF
jgi:hypothetical protein